LWLKYLLDIFDELDIVMNLEDDEKYDIIWWIYVRWTLLNEMYVLYIDMFIDLLNYWYFSGIFWY